jgi:RHS repeat-associated protein
MKLAKWLQLFVIIFAFSNLLSAQTAPNLENGFKPYGSYEGSKLDTVNLMNGNVIFHAPLIPETPQRGSLKVFNTLYSTSQDWQVVCNPGCKWAKGGAGVFLEFSPFLKLHRTIEMNHVYDNIAVQYAYQYSITSESGSVHKLHGIAGTEDQYGEPTQFDSIDLTGFHLAMSNPDSSTGVLQDFTVTDRSGNKFEGTFRGGHCTKAGNYLLSGGIKGGVYAPMQDDASVGEQYCSEFGLTSLVTDSNGNQISTPDAGTFIDTLGKTPALLNGVGINTDATGCVSPYAISSAVNYNYQDPNGVSQTVKICYSFVPIQTAFNVAGVAEDSSSSDWQFVGLMSIILPNGTYWGFSYDNYGEITSIHLPTGGSISYVWMTVNYLGCSNGQAYPYSRAVQTRTLDDGRGHTSVWGYNWGPLSGGVRVNTVTDPAGNDTVHTFTDLSASAGMGPGCRFYETSTVQYQGLSSSNNKLQRVDTSYSSSSMLTDDGTGNSELGNIFATDVVTTVYPSGKVKKVHKDPDPGLGPGLPSFGNTIKELEYDWGTNAPGPLLRETDTIFQWQKTDTSGNRPYLSAHLLDLPASTITIDSSGTNPKSNCPLAVTSAGTTTTNCLTETDYAYDEPGYLTAANISTQHAAAPWSVRGNQTTVSHWLNTSNSFIPSHTSWYDTGEVYQTIDPLGHTTTHSYDPFYAGAYSTQTCSPTTNSVAHCVSGTYEFNSGLLISLTNENAITQASGNTPGDSAHTSAYQYDLMFRPSKSIAPPDPDPANGGTQAQVTLTHSDSFPWTLTLQKTVTTALSDSATSSYDGLGRVFQSQHALPNGTATVTTTFDDAHSQLIVTNPYFSTADPTYGNSTTLSDGLGRATQITEQDGSVKSVAYDVVALSGAAGNCTLTTDEAGKLRRTCADGLGRLVEVDEPNPGSVATYAQATVSISGSEQSNPLPAAYGSGYVDIGGVEGNYQSCTDPAPPRQPVCNTAYDTGTVVIQVGSAAKSASFGNSSTTTATVASALAAAFHNDTAGPADGSISPTNSSRVVLTARSAGSAGNYALSASPVQATAPDFYGTVSGPNFTNGRDASSSPDTGTVTITLNSTAYQTTYGGSDTASTIATRLAAAISAGSWANASASGATVTITAKSTGPGGDYTLSASSTYDTAHFGQPSFTAGPSASALSGGYDPGVIDNQPLRTLYTYDAVGNLLRVEQHGDTTDSTKWRIRTFTYDSVSRLLTANNPESGTITYSYDVDGNLLQKTSPAPNQTGSATQTVSYCYDALHRVTGKGYGAQSCPLGTPVVTYVYDSGTNAKGHLTSLTDQAGTATYSYDILGRLTAETRTLIGANNASISKNLSYSYNLNGSLKTLTYPSGNVVTYTPDSAGRTLSAIDSGNGINYVTSATYGPDSALTGFVSGYSTSFAGIINAFSYNKRLQPLAMSASAPSQTVYSIGYDFHLGNGTSGADNGNVFGITNYKDQNRNQTFTYDPLNRLISAQNAGTNCAATVIGGKTEYWGNSYGYDAWGNLLQKSVTKCGAENLLVTADAHNWIHASGTDYQYDAAGNMTRNVTPTVQTYSYDEENRLTGAAGYAYTYDGDGNRVRKSNGNLAANGTLYWYMTPGIVGESDLSGNLTDEYVFFDGERVARKSTNGVFYYFSDHLKTASVITDASGNIKSESDFYPWGGELQFVNNDSNHYKFTGKERDGETQLDYFGARYYSNGLGRWVSADWSPTPIPVPYADFHDPQSLNLYGFVGGNPASKADADGHDGGAGVLEKTIEYVEDGLAKLVDSAGGAAGPATEGGAGLSAGILIGPAIVFVVANINPPTVGQSNADEIAERDRLDAENAQKAEPAPASGGAKKGGEPPQLKAGKEAHKKEEVRPGEKAEVRTPSGKRMDRYNADKAHIREIKRNNARGRKAGEQKLKEYKKEMDKTTGKDHTTELTLYDDKTKK